MRKSLDEINSRLDQAPEEKINEFEDLTIEIIQAKMGEWKKVKKRKSFSELWDNIKQTCIYIIGFPEGKEREGQS